MHAKNADKRINKYFKGLYNITTRGEGDRGITKKTNNFFIKGKCTETFDISAASDSSADNSCFARIRYTFRNKVVQNLPKHKKKLEPLYLRSFVYGDWGGGR